MTGEATLWTAAQAVQATGGVPGGPAEAQGWAAHGVSIDSRSVGEGDLFVALRGPNFDAHEFVPAALRAGAVAALVDRPIQAADAPVLRVGDTEAALAALGRAGRRRTSARVVAVTGSVGKTGTRAALEHVLGGFGQTHASAGNLNNHLGVPLSLARLPPRAEFAVLEAGMNHAGELAPLSRMIAPQIAVITAIAPVHIGNFANGLTGIADAKAEILDGLATDGAAILPADSELIDRLRAAARARGIGRTISFGFAADADLRAVAVTSTERDSTVEAELLGRRLSYRLPVPGRHWVSNSLAVLGAVLALGLDPRAALGLLASFSLPSGRGVRRTLTTRRGRIELIDDSYNASPPSVAAGLAVLGGITPPPGGRRIAVLGDMLELGEHGPALHRGLASAVRQAEVDLVFACGPLMAGLLDALPAHLHGGHAADSAGLAPLVAATVGGGDVVLVKGSAGMRMGRVIAALEADRPQTAANGA